MESACIDSTEPIFTIISLHFASQPMITRTLWYRCIVPHLETIKLQFQFSADCFWLWPEHIRVARCLKSRPACARCGKAQLFDKWPPWWNTICHSRPTISPHVTQHPWRSHSNVNLPANLATVELGMQQLHLHHFMPFWLPCLTKHNGVLLTPRRVFPTMTGAYPLPHQKPPLLTRHMNHALQNYHDISRWLQSHDLRLVFWPSDLLVYSPDPHPRYEPIDLQLYDLAISSPSDCTAALHCKLFQSLVACRFLLNMTWNLNGSTILTVSFSPMKVR